MISVIDRTIIYSSEITEELAGEFIYNLLTLSRTEGLIKIICATSEGGSVEASLSMIDYVRNCPNQIDFYCSGMQASAQALIPLAADNVYFTSETTHFLFHKGSLEVEMIDLQSERDLKYVKKTQESLAFQNKWDVEWLSNNSCKPPTYFSERLKAESELYLFAEEALSLELIDAIKPYE